MISKRIDSNELSNNGAFLRDRRRSRLLPILHIRCDVRGAVHDFNEENGRCELCD